jgi:hypothetical protein
MFDLENVMTEQENSRPERELLLSKAEWIVLAKLVGIFAMAMILLQANISFDYDLAQFIYGRF